MTSGETIVAGLAVGAGSLVAQMLGVTPGALFAAVAACFLGAPAAPASGAVRALGTFLASVILTCHAAAGVGALAGVYWPGLAAHEHRVQALAAVVIGVALHILLSHLPAIVGRLLERVKLIGEGAK
jgi:hypothetical protein